MCWAKEESCLVSRKKRRHDSGVVGTTHIRWVGKEDVKADVLQRKEL